MHPRAKAKQEQKQIAKEHIKELFEQADKVFTQKPELSHRYVELARLMQMKHKVRMPREYKRKYCKHCYHYLRSGINATIRLQEGKLKISCKNCQKTTRIPYK